MKIAPDRAASSPQIIWIELDSYQFNFVKFWIIIWS